MQHKYVIVSEQVGDFLKEGVVVSDPDVHEHADRNNSVEDVGLVVTDIEILRLHYPETLSDRCEHFLARCDEARSRGIEAGSRVPFGVAAE